MLNFHLNPIYVNQVKNLAQDLMQEFQATLCKT